MPRKPKTKAKVTKAEAAKMAAQDVENRKADQLLLEECVQHQIESQKYLANVRSTWDDKESMLIGQLEDTISKQSKNKVFDPRLATIVFERAARVMAQNLKGRAFAVSKDDVGKNLLMNLLLKNGVKNDNLQFSHLVKNRMIDLYSMVYGSMFELVFWYVDFRVGYAGPQTFIIPIRDAFPQPGVKMTNDMDWFIVRSRLSSAALRNVDPSVWKKANVDALLADLKEKKSEGDTAGNSSDERSYPERFYYPAEGKDAVFPQVTLFTEYRRGKWITWAAHHTDPKTLKNYLLRVVEPGKPYDSKLPVVVKHCFPLLDSPIGLGEFERGKTLQFAINSLIQLYLDGVKYSIFPPLAINPDNVVPTSIKWGAGEKWFMNNPAQDVKPITMSPQGIQTFNETYSFMLSALYNQAGSSEVNQTSKTESGLGKTPQAVRLQAVRESARDEWDRVMMEEFLKDVYIRFIGLYASKQEAAVTMRLFKDEIEEIQKSYPDIVEMFKSGDRGQVQFNKEKFADEKGEPVEWDFEIESGSTMKPNIESDQENLTSILKAVLENSQINDALAKQGKQVDIGELFKRWMASSGLKDIDRVIIPLVAEAQKVIAGNVMPGAVPPVPGAPNVGPEPTVGAEPPVAPVPNVAPAAPEVPVAPAPPVPAAAPPVQAAAGVEQAFQDPDVQALFAQMTGRAGVPAA